MGIPGTLLALEAEVREGASVALRTRSHVGMVQREKVSEYHPEHIEGAYAMLCMCRRGRTCVSPWLSQFVLLLAMFAKPMIARVQGTQSGGAVYRRLVLRTIVCTAGIVTSYAITTLIVVLALLDESTENNKVRPKRLREAWRCNTLARTFTVPRQSNIRCTKVLAMSRPHHSVLSKPNYIISERSEVANNIRVTQKEASSDISSTSAQGGWL